MTSSSGDSKVRALRLALCFLARLMDVICMRSLEAEEEQTESVGQVVSKAGKQVNDICKRLSLHSSLRSL